MISYGIGDDEAWLATVEAGDVREVLEDVEHVSWGELIRTGRSDPCLAGRLMVNMDVAPDGSFDLFRYAFPLTNVAQQQGNILMTPG